MKDKDKTQEEGKKIAKLLLDGGYKDFNIKTCSDHFKVDIPRDNIKRPIQLSLFDMDG